jgi:hypothetical protein
VLRCSRRLLGILVIYVSITFAPSSHADPKKANAKTSASSHAKTAATRRSTAVPRNHTKQSTARHESRHSTATFPGNVESTPAFRYAQLDVVACETELEQRQLPVQHENASWPQLKQPTRLKGPLNGVTFRTDRPESERGSSPYELLDCRLVLALDDFSKLARGEGINEVVFSSAYRPPPESADADEAGKRHAGGLAIDIHRFRRDDGQWIKVEEDFHGRLGKDSCGRNAQKPVPATPEAILLRRLVCGAATQRLFQSVLTPSYDHAHRDHLHLELTVGVRWFIVSWRTPTEPALRSRSGLLRPT